MSVSIENFEIFLLIIVRISGFIYTAPFFSLKNVPVKVKAALSILMAAIIFPTFSGSIPEYSSVIDYGILVTGEALAGALMGMFSNMAYHILALAGQFMDMEIGFSMVNGLDPVSKMQTTITSNLYGYLVLILMIVTDIHHYFIRAIIDSFQLIPLGRAVFRPGMYQLMVTFIIDYFVLAFRIVLPVFAAIMLVNTTLGILAKIAPQMNMFVIGMQLKIFVGLLVLLMIIGMVPAVADFIFNKMVLMLRGAISWMT